MNLYVHFPFCRSRCSYCSLYSRVGASLADRERYIESIRVKLESLRVRLESTLTDPNPTITNPNRPYPTLTDNNPTLKTLYFGGGSPALCDLSPLRVPLKQWKTGQTCFPLFEFTVELHPLDVTPAKLDELKSIGVNRISMGVQSLDDATLRAMGRGYTADEAARAFDLVKSRFDNAGIDLILGYPGDPTTKNAEALLAPLATWGLRHCSVYSLQNERGLKNVPDDDTVLDGIRSAARFLKSIGLERYEISNYAAPGFECRHNLAVWRGEDYIGLGEGAYGREGLKRTRGILQNSVNGDREEGRGKREEGKGKREEGRGKREEGKGKREEGRGKREEGKGKRDENSLIAYKTIEVSPLEDLKERTLFRLRTRDGIDSSLFPEWRPTLDQFVAEGLLTHTPLVGAHLRGARGHLGEMPLPSENIYYLTERGTEVCDAILEELV